MLDLENLVCCFGKKRMGCWCSAWGETVWRGHRVQWVRCRTRRPEEAGKCSSWKRRETHCRASGKELVYPTRSRESKVGEPTQKPRGFGNSQATQIWLTQKSSHSTLWLFHILVLEIKETINRLPFYQVTKLLSLKCTVLHCYALGSYLISWHFVFLF